MGTQTQNQNQSQPVSQPQPQSQSSPQRRRREYLSDLLDVWDRFNEINLGQHDDDEVTRNVADEMAMNVDQEVDGDEEMKDNDPDNNENDEVYHGVMGFVESVFDELVQYQNTIETGLNHQSMQQNENQNGNDDHDLEMK